IIVEGNALGICGVLNDEAYPDAVIAEINMDAAMQAMNMPDQVAVAELTTKLVSLDVNVVCSGDEEAGEYIAGLYKTLGEQAWSVVIVDRYPLEAGVRYTIRVTYRELSDTDAKALHAETFELNT
ncbi:MAG: hypothetical protein AAB870_04485, partial [Patescibacteria group bacterium]